MNFTKTVLFVGTALAIGFGTSVSAGQSAPLSALDADADGYISNDEAAADPELLARWSEVDLDRDGKLSAGELSAMEPTAAGQTSQEATKAMKE